MTRNVRVGRGVYLLGSTFTLGGGVRVYETEFLENNSEFYLRESFGVEIRKLSFCSDEFGFENSQLEKIVQAASSNAEGFWGHPRQALSGTTPSDIDDSFVVDPNRDSLRTHLPEITETLC